MKNENMKKSLIKERDVIITTVSAKKKKLGLLPHHHPLWLSQETILQFLFFF